MKNFKLLVMAIAIFGALYARPLSSLRLPLTADLDRLTIRVENISSQSGSWRNASRMLLSTPAVTPSSVAEWQRSSMTRARENIAGLSSLELAIGTLYNTIDLIPLREARRGLGATEALSTQQVSGAGTFSLVQDQRVPYTNEEYNRVAVLMRETPAAFRHHEGYLQHLVTKGVEAQLARTIFEDILNDKAQPIEVGDAF